MPFAPTTSRSRRFPLAWIAVLALSGIAPVAAQALPDVEVRQVWQLLDYIGVDYREAVADGAVINAGEYEEMREFAATAHERIAALPARPGQDDLVRRAQELRAAIEARSGIEQVAGLAQALASGLLAVYPVPAAPAAPPDQERAAKLYQQQCASCHGADGHGDGPLAPGLEPAPIAFSDRARARERSLFSLYQTITQGVQGTSMPGFAALSEADRWALAFYAGGLAYGPEEVLQGERLWQDEPALRSRFAGLEALAGTTEAQLAAAIGSEERAAAVLAYLRAQPDVLLGQGLALARSRLAQSVEAYAGDDVAGARRLALSAYLDGFEPIEPQLAAGDPALLARVEAAMGRYRSLLGAGAPAGEVRAQAEALQELFDETEASVQRSAGDAGAAFVGSYTILVREGLEALLIVVAILAFLRKAERREAARYVHAGWIGALLAGVLTWIAATTVISVSGAGRELTEGLSSLLAAVVLLSVGLWMHRKSFAGRWQQYVREHLAKVLNRRSVWLLAGLSFVVVYREVFETILFYVALWNAQNGSAILGGFAAGVVTLAVAAFVLLRSSARLPIGRFFAVSSALMAVLAVVLAGKGISALQEAGWIDFTAVSFPRVDLLGIYPSWQGLLAQAVVIACALAGFIANRVEPSPATETRPG